MDKLEEAVGRCLRRLPFGRKVAPLQTRLASFGEQGLQGAANLLVNVILARHLGHESFAIIGVMLGTHYFIYGIHRSAVVITYILNASQDSEDQAHRRWWWFNLLAIGLAAMALAVVAVLGFALTNAGQRWFVTGIALCVMVTPSLLFFEFGRRMLYQQRRSSTAAFASAVYLVLNLGVAALASRGSGGVIAGSLAWVAAGLGGGAIATLANTPGAPQIRDACEEWWRHRSFAFWQALTNVPYSIYNSSAVILVGLFGGATAAAAFTAARTLTSPAISIVSAVDSLDKPRAAQALKRDGMRGLRRSVEQTRRTLAVLCGAYLAALVAGAPLALHLAFGNLYAAEVPEIRLLALAFFLICMNQPSETLLTVLRKSKLLLLTRLAAATVAVASLSLARPYGLLGCVLALLATQLINLANLRIAEWVAAREHDLTSTLNGVRA